MSQTRYRAARLLRRIELFSQGVIGVPLYRYQVEPLRAVTRSIISRAGREYLLVFPRQSGKNEAVAQLMVYLLNLFHRVGGNIVFAAIGDGIGRGVQRLEQRLENPWNAGRWRKASRPARRILGKAQAVFISSSPQAHSRGETAHWLLIIDELQDQDPAHLEAVFTPMRAAYNATALYLGTVRTTSDALWKKKTELEELQARDGVRRVFMVRPKRVIAANRRYGKFLRGQVARLGRRHPIIRSEYFLEPLDGDGGLFPPRRLNLLRGTHQRQHQPTPGRSYIATLDVGGQDEGTTDAVAQLEHPGRDYSCCTIWEIDDSGDHPSYKAADILIDQGTRHFQEAPGRPALAEQLLAFLNHWNVTHTVADATGVGEGLTDWLAARLPGRVTGYKFTRQSKAWLGSAFITLIETGRVHYWQSETEFDDAWLFFQQAAHTGYTLPAGGTFERDLRWSVPESTKVSTPAGPTPLHDDRLISAALIAEADRLIRGGTIHTGRAHSATIKPADPLTKLEF